MRNIKVRIAICIIFSQIILDASAQSESVPIQVGQSNLVKLKIQNQENTAKCNIEIAIPGQSTFEKEVASPNFEVQIEVIPQQVGPITIQWKGKYKSRGLYSVGGCSGSGSMQIVSILGNEQIRVKWEQLFARLNKEQSFCVRIGLDLNKLKYQSIDSSVRLDDPEDSSVKQLFSKCDSFVATRTAWYGRDQASFACTLQSKIETTCDGVYAEKMPDGRLRRISKEQAIELHLENKPWTTSQVESNEAKFVRARQEEAILARQASELAAKKDEEERELKRKASPDFKKQQAEIAKRQLAEEKEIAARLKKEQAEAAIQAKQDEKERIAREKEQEVIAKKQKEEYEKNLIAEEKARSERDKRTRFELTLMRPLISQQDPRISCQSKWILDSRFFNISAKISLTGLTEISFPMLADQATPNSKDQQAIAMWADEFKKCISESSYFRGGTYPRELNVLLEKEDTQFLDAAIELYGKKISYGNYNLKIQKIAKETRSGLDYLTQQLQNQKAEREEATRARGAALRDAQQRQDQQRQVQEQQRQADQRRQEQMAQAERARVMAVRRQWEARCEFDRKNANEQYMKSKENSCNINSRGLTALCAMGVITNAQNYAQSAYDSCMSGAPN